MLIKYKFLFLLSVLVVSTACQNRNGESKVIHSCDGRIDTFYIQRKYDAGGLLQEVSEFNYQDSTGSVSKFYANGNVKEIRTIIKGKVFGDNEIYYKDGIMQRYQFLTDSLSAAFINLYDETGKSIERSGTPLVFKLIGTNKANDTLDVKFVFASKIFSSISSEISSDGINYLPVKFEDCDNEFPFNKVYRHIQDISKFEKIVLFFKIAAFDKYEKKEISFYDTLSLSKIRR